MSFFRNVQKLNPVKYFSCDLNLAIYFASRDAISLGMIKLEKIFWRNFVQDFKIFFRKLILSTIVVFHYFCLFFTVSDV